MTAQVLASVGAAAFAGLLIRVLCPPRRRLAERIGPYAELLRSHLGGGSAEVSLLGGSVGHPAVGRLTLGRSRPFVEAPDAALALALIVDARCHDALDDEAVLRGIAAGGERLVALAQKAGLGESALARQQHARINL